MLSHPEAQDRLHRWLPQDFPAFSNFLPPLFLDSSLLPTLVYDMSAYSRVFDQILPVLHPRRSLSVCVDRARHLRKKHVSRFGRVVQDMKMRMDIISPMKKNKLLLHEKQN